MAAQKVDRALIERVLGSFQDGEYVQPEDAEALCALASACLDAEGRGGFQWYYAEHQALLAAIRSHLSVEDRNG